MRRILSRFGWCALVLVGVSALHADDGLHQVGVARVDITPEHAVRLNGFAARWNRPPAAEALQPLWAKALAIGDGDEAAVLITADLCTLPAALTEELAARLERRAGIRRPRLVLSVSHSHTTPLVTGAARGLFAMPVPAEDQASIDRYTRVLIDKLERVAIEALEDREPARLAWGVGSVDFALNRRTAGGPVDHDLPLLRVTDPDGGLRAVLVNYACHCVALGADVNQFAGDWAGWAQAEIERKHPGAVALLAIGCGADQNPAQPWGPETAQRLGLQVAVEAERLLKAPLTPLTGRFSASFERVELPLAMHPDRAEWERRARDWKPGAFDFAGYHARLQLERLDQGQELATHLPLPVQSWTIGDELAMVFLGGEVVVDYSLRLKRELDAERLWVTAYSNAVECYVPSERVLKEGGYEADSSPIYDHPTTFQPGMEDQIVEAVRKQVPAEFAATYDHSGTEGTRALSPLQALASLRTRDDLEIELVACEPLVADPVAIDFDPAGRLWVAEMHDYPTGLDGNYQPGGRIKVLEEVDGDGRYDRATLFLDGLAFPTGLAVWRKGVLVCAAPDILYAEDTDGDGRADVRRKLYEGFATENYQGRINSISLGLDNWWYAACGLFGGQIASFSGASAELRRDCRIRPDCGSIEPATGVSQQGRVRDDWGNWFGCTNSSLIEHYPLADHYLLRNPHLAPPDPSVAIGDYGRLYPKSTALERFNDPSHLNYVTSGCGLGIYRDELLGPEYSGNSFTCEPVHNLVVRLKLSARGTTFTAGRPADEENREFLASTDNWFRPVQVRTGPDGALWVVDMYRFLIEHPRWIQPGRLATLDVRAGHAMGRIYRIYPKDRGPRPIVRLDQLDTAGLVNALDTANGTQRDLVQQMLLWRGAAEAVPLLAGVARTARHPAARLQALSTLDGLGGISGQLLFAALADEHPAVRRHAVRLSEPLFDQLPEVAEAVLGLETDLDSQVRCQVASSLGEWDDPRAGRALGRLLLSDFDDPYLRTAALSSLDSGNLLDAASAVLAAGGPERQRQGTLGQLIPLAVAMQRHDALLAMLAEGVRPASTGYDAWQLRSAAIFLDAAGKHGLSPSDLREVDHPQVRETLVRLDEMLDCARRVAADDGEKLEQRLSALSLLGRQPERIDEDLEALARLLAPQTAAELQQAAVAALVRVGSEAAARMLLAGWQGYGPAVRGGVLDELLNREAWTAQLLGAIEQGGISPADVNASQRQRLIEHSSEEIRRRAAQLLAAAIDPDRQKIVDEYLAEAAGGDPRRGADVFGKKCTSCHQLRGVGHAIGPDLAAITDKSAAAIVLGTLDPNRAVEAKYVSYTAITTQGLTHSGILAAEAGTSLTLLGQEGKQHVLARGELDEFASSGKSLMPEGLEKDLSLQDVADLVALVQSGGAELDEQPDLSGRVDDYNQWKQALGAAATDADAIDAPDGFRVELVHAARPDEGSWISLAIDPRGRLIVAREDRGLLRLTPAASEMPPGVETINDTLAECRGLLFAYDALYVNANNSKGLYRLRDTDGDDRFDEVQLLKATGGGVGHGRNDLALGPDGMIYIVHGNDVRLPEGFDIEGSPLAHYDDREILPCAWDAELDDPGSRPPYGHVVRTDRDGKTWEVVAGGLRNPYGIDFSPEGEMFTYDADMEWDVGAPWYRPTRVNHLLSGADYGFRRGTGKWPAWLPGSLPATFDIGLGSPTGVKFGTASRFPTCYRQALFILDWAYGRILAVHLVPQGASYCGHAETFLKGRPLNVTDLEFGPDGSMYFVTGGRGTQSGLYRVTYEGPPVDEPVATAEGTRRAEEAATARALRRSLEAFHGHEDSRAVECAWPHLASADPWIRHAARVAIEHQPCEQWQERALSESSESTAIPALLALARVGPEGMQERLLERLAALRWESLSPELKLMGLRACQLAFARMGAPDCETAKAVAERLNPLYPDADERVNALLAELLVYLDAPEVVPRTLELLSAAATQEERLHYLHVLRNVRGGSTLGGVSAGAWTRDEKRTYFQWLGQAGHFEGAQSMEIFVRNIRTDAMALLDERERADLADILQPRSAPAPAFVETQRPFVREWQMDDLAGSLERPTGPAQPESQAETSRGELLFAAARCADCHRLGSAGKPVGPDLTGASGRFGRRDLLEAILLPSKVIDPKYRDTLLETGGGRILVGRIVAEQPDSLGIAANPFDPGEITWIAKEDVVSRGPSLLSPMPSGLLDTLTKEEILELVAHIESSALPASADQP